MCFGQKKPPKPQQQQQQQTKPQNIQNKIKPQWNLTRHISKSSNIHVLRVTTSHFPLSGSCTLILYHSIYWCIPLLSGKFLYDSCTAPTYCCCFFVVWNNSQLMNECLTTPQHEKQIGYWVSEKGKLAIKSWSKLKSIILDVMWWKSRPKG